MSIDSGCSTPVHWSDCPTHWASRCLGVKRLVCHNCRTSTPDFVQLRPSSLVLLCSSQIGCNWTLTLPVRDCYLSANYLHFSILHQRRVPLLCHLSCHFAFRICCKFEHLSVSSSVFRIRLAILYTVGKLSRGGILFRSHGV